MEIKKNTISIIISGKSGDGIQLMGDIFANTAVSMGNYISTFSDFPSEIRVPHDTIDGVSGFHITIGNSNILDYGELCDILIAMNAASLKKYLSKVKKGGIIIIDNYGFRSDKLLSSGYCNNPLDQIIYDYTLYKVNSFIIINKLIKKYNLKIKKIYKNMYFLGFLYYICNYPLDNTKKYLKNNFENLIFNINNELLIHGFVLEKQNHSIVNRFLIKKSKILKNKILKKINGNQALALGLIMGCKKANIDIFYAGYPITPASNIFYYLSKYKSNIKTFQSEDEISAITSAIGASYAGLLGITATSGPGMSLKQEALGLASIIEIPLIIINIQRVGPSTGLPTKTEQSDLLQALYGRHGEAPIPILASRDPNNCFKIAFEAVKIAIEYMTPVIILSDSYIANSYQLWNPIKEKNLKSIHLLQNNNVTQDNFYPYKRDNRGVRPWIIPGMNRYENCIGSLEKEDLTGKISSKGINHQKMVNLRHSKINNIIIPLQKIEIGKNTGELLILSWGSTYNIISLAMNKLLQYSVSYTHLEYIYPLPNGIKNILLGFKFILIPELNNGQLIKLIKSEFLIDAIPFNKIQGIPFTVLEIIEKVKSILFQS